MEFDNNGNHDGVWLVCRIHGFWLLIMLADIGYVITKF